MMTNPSTYRVVYVEPGKPACVKEIGTELHDIQDAVGGGLFECVYPHDDRTVLVKCIRFMCYSYFFCVTR